MSKPFASPKRLIHVTREQEEKMAAQAVQKIQAFVGEASTNQSRRCEVMVALATAQAQFGGVASVDPAACKAKANELVLLDAREKWSELKALFVELKVSGPQPHLEWAAKQCGVTLFDEPEERLIIEATVQGGVEATEKVIQ